MTPPENGAPTPPAAVRGAAGFLRARMFGMPRWVWLALLVGGVGLGVYLRRRQTDAADAEADPNADLSLAVPEDLMGTGDPGLAGVGTFGEAPGSVVPVSSPLIPEGYPETAAIGGDIASALAGTIGDLAGVIGDVGRPPDATQGTGTGTGGSNSGGGGSGAGTPAAGGGSGAADHRVSLPRWPQSVAEARAQIDRLRARLRLAVDPSVRRALQAAIAARQSYIQQHTGAGGGMGHGGGDGGGGGNHPGSQAGGSRERPAITGGGPPSVPATAHLPVVVNASGVVSGTGTAAYRGVPPPPPGGVISAPGSPVPSVPFPTRAPVRVPPRQVIGSRRASYG